MKYFYFIFLFLINRVSYKIHKDIMNPVFICTTVWFILPLLYEILCLTSNNYYRLSEKFYSLVLSFILSFTIISSFIIKSYKRKKQTNIANEDFMPYIKNLLHFCIVCNLFLILRIFMITRTINIAHAINNFRVVVTENPYLISIDIKLLLYIFNLTPPLFCYIFLYNCKIKKSELIVFIIEFILMSLLYVSKGRLMKYFIMFFLILLLKKKLNFKIIVVSFFAVIGLIYFMTMSRDQSFMKKFTFMDYIFVYLLSPFPAFDMLINGKINFGSFMGGSQTFVFFYRIAAKFGLYTFPPVDKMFVNIPARHGLVPTNVYTGLAKSYMDFGNCGCFICGIIMALFYATIYRLLVTSDKKQYILFYLLTIYCLVFQFFGDLFFGFFSMIIQDFLCTLIVSKKIKIYTRD